MHIDSSCEAVWHLHGSGHSLLLPPSVHHHALLPAHLAPLLCVPGVLDVLSFLATLPEEEAGLLHPPVCTHA